MDAPTVAALKAALSNDNVWLERSTIAVFFGVVIEMADLLVFNKEMGRLQRGILLLATVLVVAGCGGEWIFEHDASQKEARLQQISDETVAQLARAEAADSKIATQAANDAGQLGVAVGSLGTTVKKETARANELATKAAMQQREMDTTVAILDKGQAVLENARSEAVAAADEAKKENASLRADVAARKARVITEQDRKYLLENLARMPKPKVVVSPIITDGEAIVFANQIFDALKEVGYPVSRPDFGHSLFGINTTGVVFEIRDMKKQPLGGGALFKAFQNLGIVSVSDQSSDVPDDDTVVLVVSTHP